MADDRNLRVTLTDPESKLIYDVIDVVAATAEDAVEKAFEDLRNRTGQHAHESRRDEVVQSANLPRLQASVTDAETGQAFVNSENEPEEADSDSGKPGDSSRAQNTGSKPAPAGRHADGSK